MASNPVNFALLNASTTRCTTSVVTDASSEEKLHFDMHFMHPLYFHLEGTNGKEVLAIRTDRMVAIVPLSQFQ